MKGINLFEYRCILSPQIQISVPPPATPPTYIRPQGCQIWSFRSGGALYSSPTVVNSMVYFGSWDRNLYALNTSSGHKMWSFPSGGAVFSSPTVVNGIVYFGSYD